MQIGIDSYGNAYDANTGYPVSLYFDEDGNAFNASTGDWIEISHDVRDTLIGILGRQGYPRRSGGDAGSPIVIPYPNNNPDASVNVGANRNDVGGSIKLSKETLMLIAGGVLIFMLGQKRR